MNRLFLTSWTLALLWLSACVHAGPVTGWLQWRGPQQNGTSQETDLPDTITLGGKNHLWTHELAGKGTPVIANGRIYTFGYRGQGPDLQEFLVCLDVENGKLIWEHGFNDFLSDIVYNRYAIGSPTVDAATGRIYMMTTAGVFACFSPAGQVLWEHSMMERFGRLTFPNGRTGAAVIDDDLVIVHGITSYWGKQGPARDRFYAFDKHLGTLVWASTPGVRPRDSSFSTPVLGWENGQRVFYAGTGCGNVVCVNVRTGEPIWRYQLSHGGVNSSVLLHADNTVIAIHGKENIDTSEVGRMVGIRTGKTPPAGDPKLDKSSEIWRNHLVMFTSSPVLAGDRVYQVSHTGELACVDANSGQILWHEKLENSQLHASPLYAEGKLYIPMVSGNLHILEVEDGGVKSLCKVQLAGGCLGSPAVWQGRIYVHSTENLYCFGKANWNGNSSTVVPTANTGTQGQPTQLQPVPVDVLLRSGEEASFNVRVLNEHGRVVQENVTAQWEKYIPPTAKVKTTLDADFNNQGQLVAAPDARISAGAFRASYAGLNGIIRGRVIPKLPFGEDFESFKLTVDHALENGVRFAYPPLPWIGARFKWEIRELDSNKVLAKTLDNVLFQRAITFLGHPDESNYTISADVMTDGNRRMKSNVGVINQRYFIALIGNWQQLEVSSNHDRIKVNIPYKWKAKTWYRLKSRVDVAADGTGVVRAKAWERNSKEPSAWTIEVPHRIAHRHGAPGLIGFSPQTRFRVYVDNISVSPN